jgi:hypothetical protein
MNIKKHLFVLLLFLVYQINSVHAQIIGHIPTECGVITNAPYYYTNGSVGSHGHGFSLYHFNTVIYEEGELWDGPWARGLKFINDTTGFFFKSLDYCLTMYKINTNTLTFFNSFSTVICYSPYGFDLFIVNYNLTYLMDFSNTNVGNPSDINAFVKIYRCSDIMPDTLLIEDTQRTTNITVHDTIIGEPFCPNLNEINFKYLHNSDTITYTILLHFIPQATINEIKTFDYNIFPNPTNEFIYINTKNIESPTQIKIYNELGIVNKSIILNSGDKLNIYIGDLNNSLYIAEIINNKTKSYYKFIKK